MKKIKKLLKIDNIVMVAVTKTFTVLKNFCSDYFAVRRKSRKNCGKTIRNLYLLCALSIFMLIFMLLLDAIDVCNLLCNQAGYME